MSSNCEVDLTEIYFLNVLKLIKCIMFFIDPRIETSYSSCDIIGTDNFGMILKSDMHNAIV